MIECFAIDPVDWEFAIRISFCLEKVPQLGRGFRVTRPSAAYSMMISDTLLKFHLDVVAAHPCRLSQSALRHLKHVAQ
jgi:hypothetical protein